MLLNNQELNLYGLGNGVLRLVAGKYKTICRLCRLTAVVSQIRRNNGCMNRWKSGYSKFVSLKPLSQRNPFLSLKIQAPSEIIWFEMRYRTDHRTLRRLSLHGFAFTKSSHHFVRFFSSGRSSLHKTVWHEAEYLL